EQERYVEALSQYRVATSLDADYLNAWKHQYALSEKIDIPLAELDRITLRLYELDPMQRHTYVQTERVSDWPMLYALALKILAQRPKVAAAFNPLAATKAFLDAQTAALPRAQRERMRAWSTAGFDYSERAERSAGAVIARTELMQALAMLLGSVTFSL